MNLDQIVALKSHLDTSRNQMDFLKSFFNPYIKISNREYIRTHAKKFLTLTAPWKNNTGVFIQDHEPVIQLTVKRIIETLHQQNIVVPTKLEYREKRGGGNTMVPEVWLCTNQ